jgi:hypothetical protein
MVDDHVQSLTVAVDDCGGAAVGQGQFFLHIILHSVELFDGFVDYANGILADHHVILTYFLGHKIDLFLELAELVD